MKLNDDVLYQKFCDKINKKHVYDQELDLKNNPKFLDNLKEVLTIGDLNKSTIKRLEGSKIRVIWSTTFCSFRAYILPEKISGKGNLSIKDLQDYISSKDEHLNELIGEFNCDGKDDAILVGKKLKKSDIKNLILDGVDITFYQDVTDWFIEFLKSERFLEKEYIEMFDGNLDEQLEIDHIWREYFSDYLWGFSEGGVENIGTRIGYTMKDEKDRDISCAIVSEASLNGDCDYKDYQFTSLRFMSKNN